MDYAVLKPKDGKRVKDPRDLSLLPEGGRRCPIDRYWRKRLADGDVEMVGEQKAASSAPVEPKKEAKKEPQPIVEKGDK